MKSHRSTILGLLVFSLSALLIISGCGGGSSSSVTQPPSVAKATISGAVSFPSIGSLVAKRAGLVVNDPTVTVKAYTIDGIVAGSAIPSYDDSAATRVYAYSIPNLNPGVDYVIKVTKNGVVLKKLIEKKDVSGNLVGQNINSVSTAAVIVASKQLGAVLGDVLPAGKTVSGLSTSISTDIKPVLLEGTIDAAVSGGLSAVNDSTKASFANVFNIVVTAADQGIDPAAMFTATPPTLAGQVPILSVATGSSTATVAQTTIDATVINSSAAPIYTAPTETAATYNAMAKQYLTSQDISNASLNYEKALAINPDDAEANFGGAITSGMMLTDDPDVQTIITKWGAVVPTVNQVVQGTSPIKLPFGNMTSFSLLGGSSSTSPPPPLPKTAAKSVGSVVSGTSATTTQNVLTAFSALKAKLPQQKTGFKSLAKQLGLIPATAPTISEMQTLINSVIIPRLDKITARLAKAEAANFSFTITKAMQGNPVYGTDVTIGAGEFYTLDAALNIFEVLFKIAGSYNFNIPADYIFDTIDQDPLVLINNPTTFTLNSGGAERMASALTNARTAAAKAKLAYDTVGARAAGTGMFDLTTWTPQAKLDFTNGLAKVKAALDGPYDVLDDLGAVIMKIDATKFFTNPLTRANFPAFGYDVPRNATLSVKYNSPVAAERTVSNYYPNGAGSYSLGGSWIEAIYCNLEPTSDLPDYTLNGILPGNTAANNVAGFNGMLPVKGGVLLHGSTGGYDIAEPNYNMSFESDGTTLYRLKQTVNTSASPFQLVTRIQQIDVASGLVTNTTGVDDRVNKIVHTTGQWWAGKYGSNASGQTLELYKFTNVTAAPWTLGTTPDKTIIIGNGGNVNAISGAGNFIYYVLTKFEYFTQTNEIHKLDVTTSIDTLISTDNSWINSIAFYNGSIYTSGDGGIKKRDATTGAIVASYANGEFQAMLGGYFYANYEGKLIKFAGTPSGGAAKIALAKYFGL